MTAQNLDAEGEFFMGAALTNVRYADSTNYYPGVLFGVGANVPLANTGLGTLLASANGTVVLGNTEKFAGFDLQHLLIPLGLMFRVGEADAGQTNFLGGAVTIGGVLTLGSFSDSGVDFRPFIAGDLILAVFKRGVLKVRYMNAIGSYQNVAGGFMTYHTLSVIASSNW